MSTKKTKTKPESKKTENKKSKKTKTKAEKKKLNLSNTAKWAIRGGAVLVGLGIAYAVKKGLILK